jgi:predicted DNA repair protein MutK
MSGFLALLDDVAAISKVAAASVDDITANAARAGTKTLGVIIDDTAVTPNYVVGITAARELPMIARIAMGSLKNKAFLIPGLLALDYFLPVAVTGLLMIGGAYLCYEGAEKVAHKLFPSANHKGAGEAETQDPTALEESRVAGAVKTDFILSAEIMTLALSMIESSSIWVELVTLSLVGVMVTALVYGVVAVIVKLDDLGVLMARKGRLAITRTLGHWTVRSVPKLLWLLTIVGTAAMLWVGGNIFIHGMHGLGLLQPSGFIEDMASRAATTVGTGLSASVQWFVTAFSDGVFGIVLGSLLILAISRIGTPVWNLATRKAQ